MSAIDPTVSLLYAQTSLAAKFTNETVAALATQPEMSRLIAAETAKQEQHQVQEAQKGDSPGKLDDGTSGHGRGQFGSRRRQRAQAPPEAEESPTPPDGLLGNLLNLKV